MEERVITLFHESIETKMQSGEILAPLIVRSSEKLVEALLNGHKIITCGNGISTAQAQTLTAALLNRFEHERPSLPAINIGADQVPAPPLPATLPLTSSTPNRFALWDKMAMC